MPNAAASYSAGTQVLKAGPFALVLFPGYGMVPSLGIRFFHCDRWLFPLCVAIDGCPINAELSCESRFAFPFGEAPAQVCGPLQRQGLLPASVYACLLGQLNSLSLPFTKELPFELRKSPHDA